MRVETFLLSLFLSLQFCGRLFAYDEPDNFAGLKFGEDVTKQTKQCPYLSLSSGVKIPDGQKIKASGSRCYFGSDEHYGLFNMGEIEQEVDDIEADQIHGKLAHVTLGFLTKKTSVVFSILQQRYGKPTAQSQQPWISRHGDIRTTGLHAMWKGRKVSITLDERDASGLGKVDYETEAWAAHLRGLESESKRAESEKLKKEADKKAERINKAAKGL